MTVEVLANLEEVEGCAANRTTINDRVVVWDTLARRDELASQLFGPVLLLILHFQRCQIFCDRSSSDAVPLHPGG